MAYILPKRGLACTSNRFLFFEVLIADLEVFSHAVTIFFTTFALKLYNSTHIYAECTKQAKILKWGSVEYSVSIQAAHSRHKL